LILRALWENSRPDGMFRWIDTKDLDRIMLEIWGNDYDRGMHCNSMMRRGLIDYHCDGDWSVDFTEEELIGWERDASNE
jgi:hypothetical protein